MRGPLLVLALACLLATAAAAPALAATPKASLPDIEDEVMCTQCGTALNISESVVAERQRAFIQRRIDQGLTKDEIKAELEAEYGPRVLAVPSRGGFDAAAWIVPVLLGVLGLAGVALAARRWRLARGDDPPGEGAPRDLDLDPDAARRLDAELAAFDR